MDQNSTIGIWIKVVNDCKADEKRRKYDVKSS